MRKQTAEPMSEAARAAQTREALERVKRWSEWRELRRRAIERDHRVSSYLPRTRERDHQVASYLREREAQPYRRAANPRPRPRMIVVANRLPMRVERGESGALEYRLQTAGGMVSALMGVRHVRMVWIGWCPVPEDITATELEHVRRALMSRGCVPVFLPAEEADLYYNGFCNDVLWPLFHHVVKSDPEEVNAAERAQRQWEAYQRVNAYFAQAVMDVAQETDLVWVHDYHLMLLPSLLRSSRPSLRVGWFLHTPWPSSEIFRTLPMRREILTGLLGADQIGFHVYDYARHFLHACNRLLGSEVSFAERRLRWERPVPAEAGGGTALHSVKVDAFPIGIDPERFRHALASPAVVARLEELRAQFRGVKVLLGVDRNDYIKGIPQKLLAMERLFEAHPEYVGKVVLLQIAVPTRESVPEYQKIRSVAHRLVGRINGRFGSADYVPIHYLDKAVGFTDLSAMYSLAAACVVTSLRDGMNLVAYEYVACQEASKGVLVLSEFAGAATALGAGSLLVNPYDVDDIAEVMHDALSMGDEQRGELHAYASRYVSKFTSQAWGQSFVGGLEEAYAGDEYASNGRPLPLVELLGSYSSASRRLLVLGVGGTFLPAADGMPASDGELLTAAQRALLRKLLSDPLNTVLLISGRSRARMDQLIAAIEQGYELEHAPAPPIEPHVLAAVSAVSSEVAATLVSEPAAAGPAAATEEAAAPPVRGQLWALAEAGVFGRGRFWDAPPDAGVAGDEGGAEAPAWRSTLQAAASDSWLDAVEEVFNYFQERTPGAKVERRDRTIRWVYGAADAEIGSQQASNLVSHLEKLLGDAPVEKTWQGTAIEVRPFGSSCGRGLMQLLATEFGSGQEESRDGGTEGKAGPQPSLPPPFDFVLALGNFSSRDEDIFREVRLEIAVEHSISAGFTYDGGHFSQVHASELLPSTSFLDDDAPTEPAEPANAAATPPTPSEAPALDLPGQAPPQTEGSGGKPRFWSAVPGGGSYTVALGNRTTHARFFLGTESESCQLLQVRRDHGLHSISASFT